MWTRWSSPLPITSRLLIEGALGAGLHVLCEKPLGMDLAEAMEIYRLAAASGRRHMTAFTYRFVPAMAYLKSLVEAGRLGRVRHARIQRLQDWGERAIGWRQYRRLAGLGELGDMGIHRIDYAEDLMGPMRSVCASMKRLVPRDRTGDGQPCPPQDVEDWVAWIAEFESGATGVFEMGKLSKGRGAPGGPRPGGDQRHGGLCRLPIAPAPRDPLRREGRALPGTPGASGLPHESGLAPGSRAGGSDGHLPLRPGLGVHQRHPRREGVRAFLLPRHAGPGRGRSGGGRLP